MTLTQALNITRIYHNIDMLKYQQEGGQNLSLFILELSKHNRYELEKELSVLYPSMIVEIVDEKEVITDNTLIETFNIFLNQLSAFLNSVNELCKIVDTDNSRFNAMMHNEFNR